MAGIAGGAGDAQGAAVGPRAWDLGEKWRRSGWSLLTATTYTSPHQKTVPAHGGGRWIWMICSVPSSPNLSVILRFA